MPKRPRNLWRRPGNSFRLGQSKPVSSSPLDEQRISLYLPPYVLDHAEDQANRAGLTLQDYCTRLLQNAIEDVRRGEQIADAEARRRSLEGYHEITQDPEYLVEWSVSASPRDRSEIHVIDGPTPVQDETDDMPGPPSPAARTVLRHAAVESDDPAGFLAVLRRGERVGQDVAFELLQALNALEIEYRDARAIDRRVAYALHRLAFEGQVLHTDAWPGALDQETVNLLRSVQEAVDRVLSGEDIRYYPEGS